MQRQGQGPPELYREEQESTRGGRAAPQARAQAFAGTAQVSHRPSRISRKAQHSWVHSWVHRSRAGICLQVCERSHAALARRSD